jgi:hypothetical protein
MYTMVASSTTWQFMFTVIAIAFTSYYFHTDIQVLEEDMNRDLAKGLPESPRLELTQAIQKCCGVKNHTDWLKYQNSTTVAYPYPLSCYPNQKPGSSGGSIFKQDCYTREYSTVRFWAALEIGLLCAGLVTSLFFLCLATAIHSGARGNWSSSSKKHRGGEENLGTADVFFVTSPHHRHHHFHHRHDHGPHLTVNDAESGGFHVHQTNGIVVSATESSTD